MTEFRSNDNTSLSDREIALLLLLNSLRQYPFINPVGQYYSDNLKLDREIVLVAVQKDSNTLRFATKELRADREILFKYIQQNYIQLGHFPSMELRDDRDVVLKLVKQDNIPLQLRSLKSEHKVSTKSAYKVRDYETKALRKRFHPTKKPQYNTNALNQRYQKKY